MKIQVMNFMVIGMIVICDPVMSQFLLLKMAPFTSLIYLLKCANFPVRCVSSPVASWVYLITNRELRKKKEVKFMIHISKSWADAVLPNSQTVTEE